MDAFTYGKQHVSFDVIRNNFIIDANLKEDQEDSLSAKDNFLLDKVINDVIG